MTLHNRVKKFGAEMAQNIDNITSFFDSATSPNLWFSTAAQPSRLVATESSDVNNANAINNSSSGLFASWFRNNSSSNSPSHSSDTAPIPAVNSISPSVPAAHAWSSLDASLEGVHVNGERRVDYVLQESTLEVANAYMSAMFAHSGYFDNKDFLM